MDGLPTHNLMYFAMFSSGLSNAVIDRHLSSSEVFVPQNDFALIKLVFGRILQHFLKQNLIYFLCSLKSNISDEDENP